MEQVVEISAKTLEEIAGSLTNTPPVSTKPIALLYKAAFDEIQFFEFSFADEKALLMTE